MISIIYPFKKEDKLGRGSAVSSLPSCCLCSQVWSPGSWICGCSPILSNSTRVSITVEPHSGFCLKHEEEIQEYWTSFIMHKQPHPGKCWHLWERRKWSDMSILLVVLENGCWHHKSSSFPRSNVTEIISQCQKSWLIAWIPKVT